MRARPGSWEGVIILVVGYPRFVLRACLQMDHRGRLLHGHGSVRMTSNWCCRASKTQTALDLKQTNSGVLLGALCLCRYILPLLSSIGEVVVSPRLQNPMCVVTPEKMGQEGTFAQVCN